MKNLTAKQIAVIVSVVVVLSVSFFYVYLKQLRNEMIAEAGIVTGAVLDREQQYFDYYGEFTALEEVSKSVALNIDVGQNKFFTLIKIDVIENTVMFYSSVAKGFFKGTKIYAKYDAFNGMTEYKITEKTRIPLPLL